MSKAKAQRMAKRFLIAFDGTFWHVRRVRCVDHDLWRNEKVYRCDKPLANDLTWRQVVSFVEERVAKRKKERP